jgi:predicted hydrolase (HD superfamily)
MRSAAESTGGTADDCERFGICGLLHDCDWESSPQQHPQRIVKWLREQGEETIARAISAHSIHWGVSHENHMDRLLIASDELTGLVTACSLIRPDGILSLTASSVLDKFKSKRFAAGVDRTEITEGVRILGVELRERVESILTALRSSAVELGLVGGSSGPDFNRLRSDFAREKRAITESRGWLASE